MVFMKVRIKIPTISALFIFLLLVPVGPLYATDNKIFINADYMKLNTQTGDSIYTGNVSFVQGEMKLSGEKIVVKSHHNEINLVKVDGSPAHYYFTENSDDNEAKRVHARSEHMQYTVNQHRLVMTINARLEQTNNIVESQRIVYDTKNQEILAGDNSGANSGARVNITLTPDKKP